MFIINIYLISQILPEEFRGPLWGPGGLWRRGAQPCQRHPPDDAALPARARKCKRDLGIFPLHSFLISVCVSAGILLLSYTVEFGSICARVLPATATATPLSPLVTEPGHKTALSPTCPLCRAPSTCAHTQPLFGCQSSPIPGIYVKRLGHA